MPHTHAAAMLMRSMGMHEQASEAREVKRVNEALPLALRRQYWQTMILAAQKSALR